MPKDHKTRWTTPKVRPKAMQRNKMLLALRRAKARQDREIDKKLGKSSGQVLTRAKLDRMNGQRLGKVPAEFNQADFDAIIVEAAEMED